MTQRDKLKSLYDFLGNRPDAPPKSRTIQLLIKALLEPFEDDESPEPDQLEQYHPWLHEGQPWVVDDGRLGLATYSFIQNRWVVVDNAGEPFSSPLNGRPMGTVWDALPNDVEFIRVYNGYVEAVRIDDKWLSTCPKMRTAYLNGVHKRPAWAANLPEKTDAGN